VFPSKRVTRQHGPLSRSLELRPDTVEWAGRLTSPLGTGVHLLPVWGQGRSAYVPGRSARIVISVPKLSFSLQSSERTSTKIGLVLALSARPMRRANAVRWREIPTWGFLTYSSHRISSVRAVTLLPPPVLSGPGGTRQGRLWRQCNRIRKAALVTYTRRRPRLNLPSQEDGSDPEDGPRGQATS
jgi:hypothetical protein